MIIGAYSIVFFVFVMFASNPFINYFYTNDITYSFFDKICVFLGGGFIFFGVFVNSMLVAKKKIRLTFYINIFLFLFSSVFTFIFVSFYKLDGAYFSFAFNALLLLLTNVVVAWCVFFNEGVKEKVNV